MRTYKGLLIHIQHSVEGGHDVYRYRVTGLHDTWSDLYIREGLAIKAAEREIDREEIRLLRIAAERAKYLLEWLADSEEVAGERRAAQHIRKVERLIEQALQFGR